MTAAILPRSGGKCQPIAPGRMRHYRQAHYVDNPDRLLYTQSCVTGGRYGLQSLSLGLSC
jgi:hypothetical protein